MGGDAPGREVTPSEARGKEQPCWEKLSSGGKGSFPLLPAFASPVGQGGEAGQPTPTLDQ